MNSIGLAALTLTAMAQPGGSIVNEVREFDVPAGSLSRSVVILGQQAGITIGVFGQPIGNVRSRRLKGVYSIKEALRRLMKGSGYDFRVLPGGQILIILSKRLPSLRPAPQPEVALDQSDIIVTSSKRNSPLRDYPAAVVIVDIDPHSGPASLTDGVNAIIDKVPVMASTYLGPGRDKIFLQGIADTSFNGDLTATVAQYLGDVRLTYNAPDPNLNLYDIKRVEILEGPQATLYGAGSLGGIIRLVPNDPDSSRVEGSVAAGFINTRHGASGSDIAGMINVPIITDRIAVRAVGYRQILPGYIDDSFRRLKDINRVDISGGRLTARVEAGDDWVVDLGGVVQAIRSRDGQYGVKSLPPLTQRSRAAQPFSNDYHMAQLSIGKKFDSFNLVSATSFVREDALEILNAAGIRPGRPSTLRNDGKISMISNETRLSGKAGSISFVGGVSSLFFKGFYNYRNAENPTRSRPSIINFASINNLITDIAGFGEIEIPLRRNLSLTMGGRTEFTRTTSRQSVATSFSNVWLLPFTYGRNTQAHVSFLPTIALSWKPFNKMLAFARYQRGFRPGGFQAVLSGDEVLSRDDFPRLVLVRYPADRIGSAQLGFRYGSTVQDLVALSVTLSHTHWTDIQADFLNNDGVPSPVNGGNATIESIEAAVTIRPGKAFVLQTAIFANIIKRTSVQLAASLPSIPGATVAASASYRVSPFKDAELTFRTAIRHTGKTQSEIWTIQPAYTAINAGMRLSVNQFGFSLDVTNIGNAKGNRFSLGNPLAEMQIPDAATPLRPRSVRLGFDAAF